METSSCLDLHRVGLARWFPTTADFAPHGTFGNIWKYFYLPRLGERVPLASSG